MARTHETPPDRADLELYAAFQAAGQGARSGVARLLGTSPQYITHVVNGSGDGPPSQAQRSRVLTALEQFVAERSAQ